MPEKSGALQFQWCLPEEGSDSENRRDNDTSALFPNQYIARVSINGEEAECSPALHYAKFVVNIGNGEAGQEYSVSIMTADYQVHVEQTVQHKATFSQVLQGDTKVRVGHNFMEAN